MRVFVAARLDLSARRLFGVDRCGAKGTRPRANKSAESLAAAGADVHRGSLDDLDSLRGGGRSRAFRARVNVSEGNCI